MVRYDWFEKKSDPLPGYDFDRLCIDQALLNTSSGDNTKFSIYKRHKECVKCLYHYVYSSPGTPVVLPTASSYYYRISNDGTSTTIPNEKTANFLCDLDEVFGDFGEFGAYELNVNRAGCSVTEVQEPVSIAFPVLTVFLLYCVIFAFISMSFALFYFYKSTKRSENEDTGPVPEEKTKKERVRSLDTFRGISIVVMIFVNYGAGYYEVLDHAVWNGLHLADLVFPWFMWIMGVCIPISLASAFRRETPRHKIFLNVLKRSCKLFALGLFLGSGPSLDCLRVFGVLQRFGICYLVVTTICIYCMEEKTPQFNSKFLNFFGDVIKLWKGWIAVFLIFFVHCLILFLVTDPDCPKGYLGPGGYHEDGKYAGCTGGATGYIDRVVLGNHMYQKPTAKLVFNSQAFDPEGLLGSLTAIVHVFIGVQAGATLLVYKNHSARLIRWFSWAIVTGLIGGGLCGFSKDDGLIPVNKNLWSISFSLVTSCFAFVLLSVCYVLVDIKKWWSGKPFLFAGMNSIILYAGHSIIGSQFPIRWKLHCDGYHGCEENHPNHFFALFENLWAAGCWVLVSYYLYKIKYFYSI